MRRQWTHLALASVAALALASLPSQAVAAGQDEASQDEAAPITLDLYTLTDVHGHIQQVTKKGSVREAGLPARPTRTPPSRCWATTSVRPPTSRGLSRIIRPSRP